MRFTEKTTAQVVEVLDALLHGSLGSPEWDSFISEPITDACLEYVRKEMEAVWVQDSPYLETGAIDPNHLSELGKQRVAFLLDQCRNYGLDANVT